MNEKEILNALKVIKNVCVTNNHEDKGCEYCPFCSNGSCVIHSIYPDEWNLVGDKPAIWRAFII